MSTVDYSVSVEEIRQARARIQPYVRHTPLLPPPDCGRLVGASQPR